MISTFILGFLLGAFCGMFVTALMNIAKENDDDYQENHRGGYQPKSDGHDPGEPPHHSSGEDA